MNRLRKVYCFMICLFILFTNCTSSIALGGNVNTDNGEKFLDYEITDIQFRNDTMYIYGYGYIQQYQDYTQKAKATNVNELKNKVSSSSSHGYYLSVNSKTYMDIGGINKSIDYDTITHTSLNWLSGAERNYNYDQVGFGFTIPLQDILGTNSSQTFTLDLHMILNDGSDSHVAINYINDGEIMDAGNYTIAYPPISNSNYIAPTGNATLVRTGPGKSYAAFKNSEGKSLYYTKGSEFSVAQGTLTGNKEQDSNGVTWFQIRFQATGSSDSIGGVTRYRVMPSSSGTYGWVSATFVSASVSVFTITVKRKSYTVSSTISNGTITDSSSVLSGDSKTISWKPNANYYVSAVKVNGVPISIGNYRGGSYTFSNVTSNQNIEVICNPCYSITTDITNGTMTSTIKGIDPGSNNEVHFSPNSGYYVSEVIVDGYAYSYKDYASSYAFTSVNSNHTIKVICEPLKSITTDITNGIITKTMTGLHPEESKKVYFEAYKDYYIDSVSVDKRDILVEDFKTGNFEFDPVLTNHSIIVICLPMPHITTEFVNGTGTSEFRVYPGDEASVHYRANENYYINKIIVDGVESKNFDEYEGRYTIKDVKKNMHVYVECVPKPELYVSKTTDKEDYNFNDTIRYTIKAQQLVENTTAYNISIIDNDIPKSLNVDYAKMSVSGLDTDQYEIIKTLTGFSVKIKELYYGEIALIEFDAKVDDSSLVGKTLTNTVYATADHYNTQLEKSVSNKILQPKVILEKKSDKKNYNVKDVIDYTIIASQTVKNAKAFNVVIKDSEMTEGVQIDLSSIKVEGVTDNAYEIIKGDNSFEIHIEELNQNVEIKYKAKVISNNLVEKQINNKATLTSLTETEVKKIMLTNRVLKPTLTLSKTTDKDFYNISEVAHFKITLQQKEVEARANDVIVTDLGMGEGIDIDYDTLKVDGIEENEYEIIKKAIGFQINMSKVSNQVVQIFYDAKIKSSSLAGSILKNSVEATCSNNEKKVGTSVEKSILKPQLTLKSKSDKSEYNVKDTVQYSIFVDQNEKNAIANDVVIKNCITDGMDIDYDTLRVEGMDVTQYILTKKENGFEIDFGRVSYSQKINILFNAKIENVSLAGKDIINSTTINCTNNDDSQEVYIKNDVLKPTFEIKKEADKEYYNYNDIIHYKVQTRQKTKNAKALNVMLDDSHLNEGLEIIKDSIKITGVNYSDYSLNIKNNGYVILFNKDITEEDINIEYDVLVKDALLSGMKIANEVNITCSNSTEIKMWKSHVESLVLKPKFTIQKTSNKENCFVGEKIEYEINLQQTIENAKVFDLELKDIADKNISVDVNTVKVFGVSPDEYKLIKNNAGFTIHFSSFMGIKDIKIKYSAFALNSGKVFGNNKAMIKSATNETQTSDVKLMIKQNIVSTNDQTQIVDLFLVVVISYISIQKTFKKKRRLG